MIKAHGLHESSLSGVGGEAIVRKGCEYIQDYNMHRNWQSAKMAGEIRAEYSSKFKIEERIWRTRRN
jgi:hypothetical protein